MHSVAPLTNRRRMGNVMGLAVEIEGDVSGIQAVPCGTEFKQEARSLFKRNTPNTIASLTVDELSRPSPPPADIAFVLGCRVTRCSRV